MPSDQRQVPAVLRWIMRATGRRVTPDDIRAVELQPGERRLDWGRTDRGEPVVATDLGLHLPGRERLDWPDVERAGWQRPELTLTMVSELEGSGPRLMLRLAEEGDLPQAVRTQVTASIGWAAHYRLASAGDGQGGVRVVGRRRSGVDDLVWQLVYDRGTDSDDPIVRAEAEQMLADARRTVG